jgi:MYXO-CTERM domain-containing protein
MRARNLASVLVLTFLPATALGHAILIDPPPRSAEIKTGPCNPDPGGATRTTYMAGQTIMVTFSETVDHVGYYHIDLALDGDTGFEQNILNPKIEDPADAVIPRMIEQAVTLPNVTCENCTLRVIQCMDPADPGLAACAANSYFSCANVRLIAADDAGPVPDGGIGPDGGAGAPDGGTGVDDGIGEAPGLGCAVGGRSLAWPALGLAGLALALLRRRRR